MHLVLVTTCHNGPIQLPHAVIGNIAVRSQTVGADAARSIIDASAYALMAENGDGYGVDRGSEASDARSEGREAAKARRAKG